MYKPQTLYKIHEHVECNSFLDIVRYLYFLGYDIRPAQIYERNFPQKVNNLPTIFFSNNLSISGLDNIIKYYENIFKIKNLLEKSKKFIYDNPNYRITDTSTHKYLKNINED